MPKCQKTHLYKIIYIYILLSPDAEQPPTHFVARTGARYEISDLREIYGAGTRNSACSSGGCSSVGGAQSAPFWRRVHRALAPQRFSETRGVPSSGAGPSQNVTCSGGGIGRTIRAGRNAVNYFRFGKTRVCIAPVSLHRMEEWVLSGHNRSKQSYHGASMSGTCLGGGFGSKIRAGKIAVKYFRSGRTRVYIRQSDCPSGIKEWVVWVETTASSRIMVLFTDCEIVRA